MVCERHFSRVITNKKAQQSLTYSRDAV